MKKKYRLIRRLWFRLVRESVFFFWRLWVKSVKGLDKIPRNEGCIIISNHTSYFDFFVLASVLRKQTVFIAVRGLNQRKFVGWFMKLDTIIYVDRDKPGVRFFKEVIRHLQNNKKVVIYPEGTRSRSGKMIVPKIGFIKLAMKLSVPIVPISMIGAFDILPPDKKIPRLRKCELVIGDKLYISPATDFLKDIFYRKKNKERYKDLSDDEMEEVAFRVMNNIRRVSGQSWDDSAQTLADKYDVY